MTETEHAALMQEIDEHTRPIDIALKTYLAGLVGWGYDEERDKFYEKD